MRYEKIMRARNIGFVSVSINNKYGAVSRFLPYSSVTCFNSQNVCNALWDAEIEGKICTAMKNK